MSGDKLLGGPQAGIVLGRAALIEQLRRNPLCRALRVDKLTLAALEATLALYLDPERALREVPVLRMLTIPPATLRQRAEAWCAQLTASGLTATVASASSAVGGGAFPQVELPTTVVRIAGSDAVSLERRLRAQDPPIIVRIVDGLVTVDPRTVQEAEEPVLLRGLVAAASS
jgi:L-seryl-tRNA(Ser) seleniumtransferase